MHAFGSLAKVRQNERCAETTMFNVGRSRRTMLQLLIITL